MATLRVSAGLAWHNNSFYRKSDYSREKIGNSVFMSSKFGCPRNKPSAVRSNSDQISKESREENLKEEVKENFKNVPECDYGLDPNQLDIFMSGDSSFKRQSEQLTAESLSCSKDNSIYNGLNIHGSAKNSGVNMSVGMSQASGGYRRRRRPPPDLPSLILDNRVLWINVPLYAEVTELIIAQLTWLDLDNPEKPIYLYIDSTGVQDARGEAVSLEYDAYGIADVLNALCCKIYTLNMSRAFGQAGMLLSLGTKGCRYILPGACVQLYLPKAIPEGGQSTDMWIRAKELEHETDVYLKFLAQGTGKSKEELANDLIKTKLLGPKEAIMYGVVDKIMKSEKKKKKVNWVKHAEKLRRATVREEKRKKAIAARWGY